ncbi:MAG: hypothetical protein AAF702_47700 [Chloroflexota bacterium]
MYVLLVASVPSVEQYWPPQSTPVKLMASMGIIAVGTNAGYVGGCVDMTAVAIGDCYRAIKFLEVNQRT